MKIRSPFVDNLGGLLASAAVRFWMGTTQCKGAFYDPTVDPCFSQYRRPRIYIFWHEYILLPLYLRGHCNLSMLLSQHHDAQILSRAAYLMGFDFVRGSTTRGGVAAIRQLMAKSRRKHLTITPDGPRGPRRHLAPGPVYLASKLRMPLVAMGYGYDRPWRLNSWDRFAIPRPFSRVRIIISPEICVPPDLDRDGLGYYRQQIEILLNRLTDEAELWAESGCRKSEEVPLVRQPATASRPHPRAERHHTTRHHRTYACGGAGRHGRLCDAAVVRRRPIRIVA
jgi:lysophospholipid acyltransferase (LPLAT)-like uncharacterized protein